MLQSKQKRETTNYQSLKNEYYTHVKIMATYVTNQFLAADENRYEIILSLRYILMQSVV